MTGIILAGGLGTRLRSVLPDTPKCLAPVNGRPFILKLLQQFVEAGVSKIILCTGYGAAQVETEVGHSFQAVPLLYSRETTPMGTGGALRLAWDKYPDYDTWLVVNGDSSFDLDLRKFTAEFAKSGYSAGLAAALVPDGSRFGALTWTAQGAVTAFQEKSGVAEPKWINAGVYLLTPAFLSKLSGMVPLSLEKHVFPAWIEQGLWVSPLPGRFIDIGVPESFAEAQHFFSRPAA